MKFNKKPAFIFLVILLCIALCATATAAITRLASKSQGKKQSYIVNRVNITFENTEFTFDNATAGETLTCKAHVSIEKTEPDFYGKLNSITISGVPLTSTVFSAGKNNGDTSLPENAVLPVSDGKTVPLEWDIEFSFVFDGETTSYNLSADIDYTTGVSEVTAQRYITSVPITVLVPVEKG